MKLDAIGIVSRDMKVSVRFYRLLGLDFPDSDEDHIEAATSSGLRVMLDDEALMKQIYPGWKRPVGQGMMLAFRCESPKHVDEAFQESDLGRLQGEERALGCILGTAICVRGRSRWKFGRSVCAALTERETLPCLRQAA